MNWFRILKKEEVKMKFNFGKVDVNYEEEVQKLFPDFKIIKMYYN